MLIGSRFSDNKAGMSCVDKDRIARIIAENTSDGFDSHEQKRGRRIERRLQQNKQLVSELTEEQIRRTEAELDKMIGQMEDQRSLGRVKVHIDMDAFFSAVECRDDARLRTVPMAVGSDSMLSTSNYLARTFGVRSAMPGFIAKKLCPELVVVPCRFSKYKQESAVIRRIFEHYDKEFSMGSLDEASLDLTDYMTRRNAPVRCTRVRYAGPCVCRLPLIDGNEEIGENAEKSSKVCKKCGKERMELVDSIEFGTDVDSAVEQLRFEVEQATGLTCSAGIAANSMLAKICSDLNKPNGQYRLPSNRDAIIAFMSSLPIRKVPGIGPVNEAVLRGMGMHSCGDLFCKRAVIRLLFPRLSSDWFLRVSLGMSSRDVAADESFESNAEESNPKSTSIERTFAATKAAEELMDTVHSLSTRLVKSLPSSGILGGHAATLKVKFANFDVITRCKSVDFLVSTVDQLFPIINSLLRKEMKENNMAIRLLGVRLSRLVFADEHSETVSGVQVSLAGFVQRTRSKAGKEVVELDSSSEEEKTPEGEEEEERGRKRKGKREEEMREEEEERGRKRKGKMEEEMQEEEEERGRKRKGKREEEMREEEEREEEMEDEKEDVLNRTMEERETAAGAVEQGRREPESLIATGIGDGLANADGSDDEIIFVDQIIPKGMAKARGEKQGGGGRRAPAKRRAKLDRSRGRGKGKARAAQSRKGMEENNLHKYYPTIL